MSYLRQLCKHIDQLKPLLGVKLRTLNSQTNSRKVGICIQRTMVTGKVALVTGGSSGIGRATCQVLAREGAKVVVADIDTAGAEETLRTLCGAGHISLFMDVASNESVEAGIKAIKDRYQKPPTVCVNSACILLRAGLLDSTKEEYNRMMVVNVEGTINTTKAVCRQLVEAKLPGTIVNMSSLGVRGVESSSIYCATKGAVMSFSKTVAKEFGRHGIRCNIVFPGAIDTPMLKLVEKRLADGATNASALKRWGRPEEVAEVNVFLASDKSSYMTGACVYVDGGL